jgi:hypothetical protein
MLEDSIGETTKKEGGREKKAPRKTCWGESRRNEKV